MHSNLVARGIALCTLLAFSGCNFPKDMKSARLKLRKELNLLLSDGDEIPQALSSPDPSTDTMGDAQYTTTAAKNAKANAEILHEMYQVVYIREPKDRNTFGGWVDTLNQGASFEGVYNGLIHSADYRKLEASKAGASVRALRAFAEELAYLELELPIPTQFDSMPQAPDVERGEGPLPSPQAVKVLSDRYAKHFVATSIYGLKKILGDEALKVVSKKNEFREKLALWYSTWAVRVAQRDVDFGIPLRNKSDEAFHYKWAVGSTEDRIKWEVLNRVHRILNEANKLF